MDFFRIVARNRKGTYEIYPQFIVKSPSNDLMIRGGDFYAIWCEDRGLWSTSEQDLIDIVNNAMREFYEENKEKFDGNVKVMWMDVAENGVIDSWHRYCKQQMRDSFHVLDETIIWSNMPSKKGDYASKRLAYPLEFGNCPAWDRLIGVLYSPEERHKIEWAIGSIVSGDSKKIQKFLVLYGEAGTGKSTVLNIIQALFDGYYSVFDAKALGSSTASFALEAFKNNPLVAIQHDGDLSRIEDNTRLNSLVSHETMTVNNKFEKLYSTKFKCFLFMGTNKPVKITDAKSGLLRRLIDVTPSGDKVSRKEYNQLIEQIKFELGAIAWHCRDVYLDDPEAYDDYIPIAMMGESNDFYNFMEDSYFIFKEEDGTTLKSAWEMYKTFCEEAKLGYPLSKTRFKSELRNYFVEYLERYILEDGTRVRNYYKGFRTDKFDSSVDISEMKNEDDAKSWIELTDDVSVSIFDKQMAGCPAQYANADGKPKKAWDDVTTTLADIDTTKLHYVRVPEEHIVIDFDIPDEDGNKSLEKNIEAASKWPKTYCELSKSGSGIHLHYIYKGDPKELSCNYAPHIEVKVFSGKQSLRRKLTKCNNWFMETISSGLPLKEKKGAKKMVNFENVKNEAELVKAITRKITKALNKEVHASTAQNINYIEKVLEDAYETGIEYDVSDLKMPTFIFASNSTNQSELCKKKVMNMKWRSAEKEAPPSTRTKKEPQLVIFDVETVKNLFLVCWKFYGKGKTVFRWFNPKPAQIEELFGYDIIGFNNRHYDNHMCYECMLGSNNRKLYDYNKAIINTPKGHKGPHHGEAWNASYTDIFEFASTKQSLKKWEIELEKAGYDISHKELAMNWDEEVPEDKWDLVADYCENDVLATEALFDYLQPDFIARKILAVLADKTPNDTTNSLTTKIMFGNEKKPQPKFNYRNMGDSSKIDKKKTEEVIESYFGKGVTFDEYTVFDSEGRPVFPGYLYDPNSIDAKSTYRGEVVGEGGYVYAEVGCHVLVGLDDVASMHPSSIEAENLFGPYTVNFSAIKQLRIHIKHHEFDEAKRLLDELLNRLYSPEKAREILKELEQYLTEENADALSYALKIAINSVYGLTDARFECEFKDPRNIDNIVAKRGALFMVNLKHEVQKRGYTVAHIKTDSIKVPNVTPEILDFIFKYGQMYGYTFEHEATYEKMCLVNDAVYIAQYSKSEKCEQMHGYIPGDNKKHFKKNSHPWTATGTQFQVPYVFKSLFSHEPIEFFDMCETKEVKKGTIYLDMNSSLPDVSYQEKELKKLNEKFEKGFISDTTYEPEAQRLKEEITKGHNYVFVGRVGLFCPIKNGHGGGELMCYNNGKYNAVSGTKKETNDCMWMEADMVKSLHKEDDIELGYYRNLCDKAKEAVSKYCDFEWFISEDSEVTDYSFMNIPIGVDEEVPWDINK